jgi:hypothetical protein
MRICGNLRGDNRRGELMAHMGRVASGRPGELQPERGREDGARTNSALWSGVLLGSGLLAVAAAIAETPAGPVSTGVVGLGTLTVAVAGFLAGRMSQRPLDELIEGLFERPSSEQTSARAAAAAELGRELERSRRYGHTFTIVRVDPGRELLMADPARTGWRLRSIASAAAARLRACLRSVDHVWTLRDQIYVLMPECDRVQASRALGRVDQADPGLLCPDHVRLATFPADGLTIPALLGALEQPLDPRTATAQLEQTAGDI